MSWNAYRPRDTDQVADITNAMQSNRSALDSALQRTMHWSDNTAAAGSMITSSFTGTARMDYGPRALITFPGQAGNGHVISDESRLGIWLNTDLVVIGSKRAVHGLHEGVVNGTSAQILGIPLNTKQLVQSGTAYTDASGAVTVTFGTAYSGIPRVMLTSSASVARSEGSYVVTAGNSITATDMDLVATYVGPGADPDEACIQWRSVGTVVLDA